MPRTRTTPRNLRTVEFGADYLKVSQRTIRRYIADGLLPAHKVGGTLVRIDQADLDALIRPLATGLPDSGFRERRKRRQQDATISQAIEILDARGLADAGEA